MKKGLFFCLAIIIGILGFFMQSGIVYADGETVRVITESCMIYQSPKLDYSLEEPETDGVVLTLSFGDILDRKGDEIPAEDDSGFHFYPVSAIRDGIEYEGYIIVNFVTDNENIALEKKLDPNARALKQTNVYSIANEANKLILDGKEVVLKHHQDVKVLDGYDSAKNFHEIMFEKDGVVYRGYIKTADLLVDGFDGTIILVVFILILVLSIVLSIYMATRKKRKKLRLKSK